MTEDGQPPDPRILALLKVDAALAVDAQTACWIWTGVCADGSGVIYVNGRRHRVHRLFWTMS